MLEGSAKVAGNVRQRKSIICLTITAEKSFFLNLSQYAAHVMVLSTKLRPSYCTSALTRRWTGLADQQVYATKETFGNEA